MPSARADVSGAMGDLSLEYPAGSLLSACGCDLYADSPAFEHDGSWDGKTRRIAINARLLDDFEAADWPVTVIDGKHLW